MLIDWFTLAAQIVNFLVLVWLLKRFLWVKLIRAIDDRENRIAARLADAAEKDKEAERRVEEMNARTAEQERERTEILAQTRRDADEARLELMGQARDGVRKQEAVWRENLEREKTAFLTNVRQRTADEVLGVVRHALTDLACADIQHCATEVFLERLQTMDVSKLRELASNGRITVLSAADLPVETRNRIEAVLASRLGQAPLLEFVRRPAMSWGLELRNNGRVIGWTPDSYLEALEERLGKVLTEKPKALVG